MVVMDTIKENVTVSFVVTPAQDDYLRERARREDRSLSTIMRRILEAVMKAEPLPVPELVDDDGA